MNHYNNITNTKNEFADFKKFLLVGINEVIKSIR